MKKLSLLALAALATGSMQAQAADYGVGVSVQSNDSTIYAPIDFDNKFRVEPTVRYSRTKLKSDIAGDTKVETLDVGAGVFALTSASKSVRLYYGGRISYLEQKITQPSFLAFPTNTFSQDTKTKSDGVRIAPTIGFEYLVNERLSLGGEAAYFYQNINGDSDTRSSGTDTRLIVRFKF